MNTCDVLNHQVVKHRADRTLLFMIMVFFKNERERRQKIWSIISVLLKFHPGTLGDNKYIHQSSTMYKNKDTGVSGHNKFSSATKTKQTKKKQSCCDNYTIMQKRNKLKQNIKSEHTWTDSEPRNQSKKLRFLFKIKFPRRQNLFFFFFFQPNT